VGSDRLPAGIGMTDQVAPSRERIGAVGDFRDSEVKVCSVFGRSVGVIRKGDEFFGILNVCPHRGAGVCEGVLGGTMLPSAPDTFNFGMDGFVLRCPWHKWQFDIRTGKTMNQIDDRSLKLVPVHVEDDQVYVGSETGPSSGAGEDE